MLRCGVRWCVRAVCGAHAIGYVGRVQRLPIAAADLVHGVLLREPLGAGPGYWVGCPGVWHRDGQWVLSYRVRRPRGVVPDRGGEIRLATSTDGVRFDDVAQFTKDQFGTASLERSALARLPDGTWNLFVSYVDPVDDRWCTAVLRASELTAFDPARREVLFRAGDVGLEGVKDPWLLEHAGRTWMFLSVAQATTSTTPSSHATRDIYNTGDCVSATALASSVDHRRWDWHGVVFAPQGDGWDRYCRRIACVLPHGDGFVAAYDGSAGAHENYEERTGWATSPDLMSWRCQTPDGPAATSGFASGSLRYLDVVRTPLGQRWFGELARPDGAHELRCALTRD